jgi:hypothetical protein
VNNEMVRMWKEAYFKAVSQNLPRCFERNHETRQSGQPALHLPKMQHSVHVNLVCAVTACVLFNFLYTQERRYLSIDTRLRSERMGFIPTGAVMGFFSLSHTASRPPLGTTQTLI